MPKVHSLEKPSPSEARELAKEVSALRGREGKRSPESEPRLTFTWPLSKDRQDALEMMETGEARPEKVADLLRSNDFIMRDAGLFLLNSPLYEKPDYTPEQREDLLLALQGLSTTKDPHVRVKTIEALSTVGGRTAVTVAEQIRTRAREVQDKYTTRGTLKFLGKMGEEAIPALERIIQNEDHKHKLGAIDALSNIKGKKVRALLMRVIDEREDKPGEDREIRRTAAHNLSECLAKMGTDAMSLTIELSHHEDPLYREFATHALGKIDTSEAATALKEMARDRHSYVRKAAAHCLGRREEEDPEYKSILQEMAGHDSAWQVMREAENSLRILKERSIVWPEYPPLEPEKKASVRKPILASRKAVSSRATTPTPPISPRRQ